jgi:hypothetical protein
MWSPDESWRDSYDSWKLRSPDDEYLGELCEDYKGWNCHACEDIGWLVFEDGYVVLVIPCTECSEEVSLYDL